MKPITLDPPHDPFREAPEPDLSDALDCICGRRPDWDRDMFGQLRLFCYKHCVKATWGNEDDFKEIWNDAVSQHSGESLKDEGMAKVTEHNEAWMHAVMGIIKQLAKDSVSFTSEDVRFRCGGLEPKSPNAWGAAFSTAARQGLIERCGYQKNTLPSAHARVVAVWRGKAQNL